MLKKMRIAKFIANAGFCSRREAEKLIEDKIQVNSAHHQSVKKLGENFTASAFASDEIIEAIEHTQHPWCIGIQWHPEFLITDADIAIVKDFINHA